MNIPGMTRFEVAGQIALQCDQRKSIFVTSGRSVGEHGFMMKYLTMFLAVLTLVSAAAVSAAVAPAWWTDQRVLQPTGGSGLTGAYFDNEDFTAPVTIRRDAKIDFSWGGASPAPGVTPGTYSVRWTGKIQPEHSETYTFSTTSNDGVKVWVNNVVILDKLEAHEERDDFSAPIALTANQKYDIRVDYYQKTGSASMILRWKSASQASQIVPEHCLYPDAITVGAVRNDFTAVNIGQLKHIASRAIAEMNQTLPGGAGVELNALLATWQQPPLSGILRNDYAAVDQGQVKALAKKFYDRLHQTSPSAYSGQPLISGQTYPWTATTTDDNAFAAVNIGQLKQIFSFIPSLANPDLDTDGDGMTNGWESAHGLNSFLAADGATLGSDGWSNTAKSNRVGKTTVSIPAETWPTVSSPSSSFAVGATSGTLEVDKNGAATYSIPLWVTPGTAGVQPKLSLNYSSQGGAGIAGFGWSLAGMSAISRGPQTMAVDQQNRGVTLTATDRFYLDGQRLVKISENKEYGQDGAEYRTEIDSVSKIISHGSAAGSPLSFTVWTKAGLIIDYGHADYLSSRILAQGRNDGLVAEWAVSRISDTKGNYMTFQYEVDTDEGEFRVKRIYYTGNESASLAPYACVQFVYIDRPDKFRGYVAGSKVARSKRLHKVQSYLGTPETGTLAREYELEYETRDHSQRSLLKALVERAGSEELPKLTFEYEEDETGWDQSESAKWAPPNVIVKRNATPRGTGFVDLNGDGRPDFLSSFGGNAGGANPNDPGAGTGLTGNYYNGMNFETQILTRVDGFIDFNWPGSPVSGVSGDQFSVRWTGAVRPLYNELYTFTTNTDDGVRLWINGQLMFPEDWTNHGPAPHSGTIFLQADHLYEIKLEYFENGGGATAQLFWSSESQSEEIIPQDRLYPVYTSTGGTTGPAITLLSPVNQNVGLNSTLLLQSHATDPDGDILVHNLDIRRPDGTWNYDEGSAFGTGEPFQGGPVGTPSNSTRSANFTFNHPGEWQIRSYVHDASTGYAHSETVSVNVIYSPSSPIAALISPQPQTVVFGTTLQLSTSALDDDGNIVAHNLDIRRPDGVWNYDSGSGFGTGEPFQGGPIGSGYASTRSASFTFNQVGTWRLRAYVVDALGAYFHTAENAIEVVAAPSSQGDGLSGQYYEGIGFNSSPVISRVDSTINSDTWSNGTPDASLYPDTFSVRWTGWLRPRFSGTYSFRSTSDDGIRVWVNNHLIIDNWTDHGETDNTGTVTLAAGILVPIKVEYYESVGGATVKLRWSSDLQAEEIVPQSQLYSTDQGNDGGTGGENPGGGDEQEQQRQPMIYAMSAPPANSGVGAWINDPVHGWVAADGTHLGYSDFRPPVALAKEDGKDTGARIVDFNGDGRADMFGLGAGGWQFYRNTGEGFESDPNWNLPVPAADVSYAVESGTITKCDKPTFVDLNGDGRVDMIAKVSITYIPFDEIHGIHRVLGEKIAWINTGAGWDIVSWYYPPLDLERGSRLIDVNGDGLPDHVQHWRDQGTIIRNVALNTGTGWQVLTVNSAEFNRFLPPLLLNQNDGGSDAGVVGTELVDLNGDGLVDLLARCDSGIGGVPVNTAYFNTGNGWVLAPTSFRSLNNLAENNVPQGVALLDINGDGRADLVRSWLAEREVHLGTSEGWRVAASPEYNLVRQLSQPNLPNTGTDFVDIDADGVADQIWNYEDVSGGSGTSKGAAFSKVRSFNRLKKVTNGFGVAASIAYAAITDRDATTGAYIVYDRGTDQLADTANVIGPMYVVKAVTHDDGLGGDYVVEYRYGGLRAHRVRGSLGFEWMRVTDSRTQITSEAQYRQDFPYTGMPASSTTKKSDGTVLSSSTITYATVNPVLIGVPVMPYASQTVQSSFELDGSLISTTTTSVSDIDAYGNVKAMSTATTGGFEKITTNVYAQDDVANWRLGRLTKSTVVSKMGSEQVTRTSGFRYDTSTGLLTDEAVEPNFSGDGLHASASDAAGYNEYTLRTTYGYDPFGNKNSVTIRGLIYTVNDAGTTVSTGQLDDRSTTTEYLDGRGRFPTSTSNQLGHTESYTEYDQLTGALKKMTGANDLETTWTYDVWGRKKSQQLADDSDTTITYHWANALPSGAVISAPYSAATPLYAVQTTTAGATPTLTYYDKFGREILVVGVNGNGRNVFVNTHYDSLGRAYAKSNPYFANASQVNYSVTTEFDLLNRPKTIRTPSDDSPSGTDAQGRTYVESTFTYAGLKSTATDASGRKSETEKNSQGWTITSTRNVTAAASAPASSVTYGYDAAGNLRNTSVTGDGTTVVLIYDQRGRKMHMTDADMGVWQYRYNAFGELIWQKDARGMIVRMGYDKLGRMTTRTEPNDANTAVETTTWTYDTAVGKGIGKLASLLISVGSDPARYGESYIYDDKGRLKSSTRVIDNVSYTITQTYGSYSRVETITYPSLFKVRHDYNAQGYLWQVRRDDSGRNDIYWQAEVFDLSGKIALEAYGNGLEVFHSYSQLTGRLKTDRAGIGAAGAQIQSLTYSYDRMGNVTTRSDAATNRGEVFEYDGLDRLKRHYLAGAASDDVSVNYFANGNISFKSDVGNYDYTGGGLHSVKSTTGGPRDDRTYEYDGVGNMKKVWKGNVLERQQFWTSFNQLRRVEMGTEKFAEFTFGAAHERVKQVSHSGTTIYVSSLYEKVTGTEATPIVEHRNYIFTPSGRIAIYTERSDSTKELRYFHADGLGSITAVTNEFGQIVKRFAFDAWGKRVAPSTNGVITGETSGKFTRGYTDHEQMDDFGVIHMNGRVYDPVLGRFLSADPHIDGVSDAQGYNRYTYVGNNPMNATDPSGFFKFKDFIKVVAIIVVAAVAAHFAIAAWGASSSTAALVTTTAAGQPLLVGSMTLALPNSALASGLLSAGLSAGAVNGVIGGLAAGFASGFAGSLLNGGSVGDAFKAGFIGAVAGAITGGVGGHFQTQWGAEKIIAKSAAGGISSEIQGGDWRDGAILSVSMETLAFVNYRARQVMINQSRILDPDKKIAYNSLGKSRSFWGDFFKLGGARHVAGKDWRTELADPAASTMGRMQGGPGWIRIFGIHTFHYSEGSFGDHLVEAYAGIHDFLNSWSYDDYGNNITRHGISKLFGEVLNYANVVPATPFAAAAAYSHFSLVDPTEALRKKD